MPQEKHRWIKFYGATAEGEALSGWETREILGHLNWKKKNTEQTYRDMEKGTPGRGNSLSKGVEVGQAWSVCEKCWKVLLSLQLKMSEEEEEGESFEE